MDAVIYAPFDLPGAVARALDRIAPALLVLVDTELWPALLRACRRRGVRTLVVNGRISDRSYGRYRRVRRFMRRVLADVDRICAQTDDWRGRFIDIGADPQRVTVTGNLKFDAAGAPSGRSGAPSDPGDPPSNPADEPGRRRRSPAGGVRLRPQPPRGDGGQHAGRRGGLRSFAPSRPSAPVRPKRS